MSGPDLSSGELEQAAASGGASAAAAAAGERVVMGIPSATLRRYLWGVGLGIALVSATVAYAVVRATMRRAPIDDTTERIQSLIDEANRLLKQLGDQD